MLDMSVTFEREESFFDAGRDALVEADADALAEAGDGAASDAAELLLWCSLSAMVETDELRSKRLASKSLRKVPEDCMAAEAVEANSGDS